METLDDELEASGIGSETLVKCAHTMRGENELNYLAERFRNALCGAVDKLSILRNKE